MRWRPAPALTVALVATLWGTVGVIVREVDLPAVAIVASRVWLAAGALGVWLAVRDVPGERLLTYRPGRTVAAGVVLAGHWVALVEALQRAPIGTVLLLTYLAPVAVAAAAPKALGEIVPRTTVVALGLGVAGMALVVLPGGGGGPDEGAAGVVLAVVAGASLALLTILSKPLSEGYGGVRLAFLEMSIAGLALLPLAATADWGPFRPSWLWLVVLGVVHSGAAVAVYLGALARLPASSVGILAYLEPVGAVLFGWLLLSESPHPATLAGGALILAAGVLVVRAGAETVPTPEVAGARR
jgi:drug/metabolite transporter (DMT)-like permease